VLSLLVLVLIFYDESFFLSFGACVISNATWKGERNASDRLVLCLSAPFSAVY